MQFNIVPEQILGFPVYEIQNFHKLLDVFQQHISKNAEKNKYYEGNIPVGQVNLGIALPEGLRKLEIGCAWGAKTVDVLAARSMFDGYVGLNGEEIEDLDVIVAANNLVAEYAKACRDELKFGCTFATLSGDNDIKCKIRFHSPQTAAGLWDGEKGRIYRGFAIIDTAPDEVDAYNWTPSLVNYYTDDAIWVLTRHTNGNWYAEENPHKMGRPLMEALIWNATSNKPFGRSRY